MSLYLGQTIVPNTCSAEMQNVLYINIVIDLGPLIIFSKGCYVSGACTLYRAKRTSPSGTEIKGEPLVYFEDMISQRIGFN